jgi:Flp pilus assembly protein TadG
MGRWARRPWRGLSDCRRATAALEFVLVSAPLLLLLFGFIATNAIFYTWAIMQNNVQYAALMFATGQVTSFSTSGVTCSGSVATTQVEYYACSGLPSWATFTATSAETCTVPNVSVTLSVNASTAGLADIYSLFSGKTLTAQSTTMKQGNCP